MCGKNHIPEMYFDGNRGLLNSPFFRDVLRYVNAQEPSGAAVPGILYSVSNVYFAYIRHEYLDFHHFVCDNFSLFCV